MIICSATGGPWEILGALIKKAGQEDSSGYRRCLAELLWAHKDFDKCVQMTSLPLSDIKEAYKTIKEMHKEE